jgi:hypothetical protein
MKQRENGLFEVDEAYLWHTSGIPHDHTAVQSRTAKSMGDLHGRMRCLMSGNDVLLDTQYRPCGNGEE